MSSTLHSVTQALRVLDALKERRELGVTDISQLLECAVSTAHRIATTLVACSYAEQIAGGKKYRLGPAMRPLHTETEIARCTEIAMPYMRKLRDATGETAQLAVLERTTIRFIAAFESERIMRVTSRVGTLMPAHTTAAGKLLLSQLDTEAIDRLYPQGLPSPETSMSVTSMSDFREAIVSARADGFALNIDETELGVSAIAVGIARPGQATLCALTLTGPTNRLFPTKNGSGPADKSNALDEVLTAAAQISQVLAEK